MDSSSSANQAKRSDDVTPVCLITADAQCCSLVQVKIDSLTVSWKTSFHKGHRYMCLSVTAVRLPGDPLTLNEPS